MKKILLIILFLGLPFFVFADSILGTVSLSTWQGDVISSEYLSSGADVKSGTVATIIEGSTSAVTFTSSFTETPQCTVSFNDGSSEKSVAQVESEAITGFTLRVLKVGGGGNVDRDVSWICTDVGN